MKVRNKFEGITLELLTKEGEPLHHNQRWNAPSFTIGGEHQPLTEENKVLVHNEVINIAGINIKIGGFEYEVEMTVEETVQQIKNAREIFALIREEAVLFADFIPVIMQKVGNSMEVPATASASEETGVPIEPLIAEEKATSLADIISNAVKNAMANIKS